MQLLQAPSIIDVDSMSEAHLGHLLALARLHTPHSPLYVLEHARSITAEAKQRFLPRGIWVEKSISLLLGKNHLLLISSLGDFRLSRQHYEALARILRLTGKEGKDRQINPAGISPHLTSGLPTGMVSPFSPPGFIASPHYTAIVLLPPQQEITPTDRVAISLSLERSLIFPASLLRELILDYNLRYHRHTPVIELCS